MHVISPRLTRTGPTLRPTSTTSLRPTSTRPRSASCQAEKEGSPFEFGRFVRTIAFFNNPIQDALRNMMAPFRATDELATAQNEDIRVLIGKGPDARPAVLVTGATGGLGKRVVARLLQKGVRVRALVRNDSKAASMLGGLPAAAGARLEVIAVDLTQPATLRPELFEGVRACVNCAGVKIRPKNESDEAVRDEKYYGGIKFFDPKVVDDTPEAVESKGVASLLKMLTPQLATGRSRPELLNVREVASQWGSLDDVVMGGRSKSGLFTDMTGGENGQPAALFRGFVTEQGNGGFASVRSRNFEPALNLAAFDGIVARVRGDGQRYKFTLRDAASWDGVGYCLSVDTKAGEWQDLVLPFAAFRPVFRAKSSPSSAPLDPAHIASIQVMLSKFEYDGALNPRVSMGEFELPIQSIAPWVDGSTPRFVHVSSAGVTRPDRPGPPDPNAIPAQKLNEMLGGLLTFKLEGEDHVRSSGIPYAVVRPCALTEEPAGAPVALDQGDTIKGKISREDVADLCVHLLDSRAAVNKTFEVKSTVPTTEDWTGGEASTLQNWESEITSADIKLGVTGKTINGVYTGRLPEKEALKQAEEVKAHS